MPKAVENYRQQRILAETNEAFCRLKNNWLAWQGEKKKGGNGGQVGEMGNGAQKEGGLPSGANPGKRSCRGGDVAGIDGIRKAEKRILGAAKKSVGPSYRPLIPHGYLFHLLHGKAQELLAQATEMLRITAGAKAVLG